MTDARQKTNGAGMFDLSGRTAIVTGAGGILGRRFAHGLARHGADLLLADIDAAGLDELADAITAASGARALAVPCDVSRAADVESVVELASERFGRVDVLVNNAATKTDDPRAFFAPTEAYEIETWRQVMSVNLDGMFLMARSAAEAMKAGGRGGSIIQTASIYGIRAPDPRIYRGARYEGLEINTPAVYSASKAGVVGLSRHLATLWAPHGIRVNTLTPGGCASGQNDEFQRAYGERVPLGRMARPEEMVGAVVYLASDASSYVTGHNLVVDGGLSAW